MDLVPGALRRVLILLEGLAHQPAERQMQVVVGGQHVAGRQHVVAVAVGLAAIARRLP